MNLSRRGLILGAASTFAAPAICKAEILMPVRSIVMPKYELFEGVIPPLHLEYLRASLVAEFMNVNEFSPWEAS